MSSPSEIFAATHTLTMSLSIAAIGRDQNKANILVSGLNAATASGTCPQFLSKYLQDNNLKYSLSHNDDWIRILIDNPTIVTIYVFHPNYLPSKIKKQYVDDALAFPLTANSPPPGTYREFCQLLQSDQFVWDKGGVTVGSGKYKKIGGILRRKITAVMTTAPSDALPAEIDFTKFSLNENIST